MGKQLFAQLIYLSYSFYLLKQINPFMFSLSIWEEEDESGGNGCDCVVRIHSADDIGSFLGSNGSVPIPPYLNRDAVASDKVSLKCGGSPTRAFLLCNCTHFDLVLVWIWLISMKGALQQCLCKRWRICCSSNSRPSLHRWCTE